MVKLLSANFLRLKKDKLFWAAVILMAALGVFFPVRKYLDTLQSHYIENLDSGFFAWTLFIGVIMAVFCSCFIGTEYSDGTIRNKIVVGQKRGTIYLANLIVSSAAGIVICAAYLIPYLCVGIPLFGFFAADGKLILLTVVTVLLLMVAFSSLFTFIAMICQSKSAANIICILLAFGLLMTAAILNQMLEAPPTHMVYFLDEDGNMASTEEANPKYLEGIRREIVQTLYDILPGGQAIQCAIMTAVHPLRLPLYSLAIIVLATGGGCVLFQKKDLR